MSMYQVVKNWLKQKKDKDSLASPTQMVEYWKQNRRVSSTYLKTEPQGAASLLVQRVQLCISSGWTFLMLRSHGRGQRGRKSGLAPELAPCR